MNNEEFERFERNFNDDEKRFRVHNYIKALLLIRGGGGLFEGALISLHPQQFDF